MSEPIRIMGGGNNEQLQAQVLALLSNDALAVGIVNTAGSQIDRFEIMGNTTKDGSGTAYSLLQDSDGHLQVDVLSGGGGGVQYTEGETDATLTGTIALAEGPSDTATPLQVDASKHLQVDIAADSVGIGGGTQYTEGDTDATITGTAIMWEDGSDTLRAVSAAKPLPIEVTDATITVDTTGTAGLEVIQTTAADLNVTEASAASILADTAIMSDWDNAASDGASVSGDAAHDAVDAGEPVKTGGKAIDYEPDTEDEQGALEVAANDRVNGAYNLRGQSIHGVNKMYHLFNGAFPNTGLDGRYDDSPTTSTSEAVECWNFRYATFFLSVVSNSAPTDMTIECQVTFDDINWHKLTNDAWGSFMYEDTGTATEIHEAYTFDLGGAYKIRFKITCTGTDVTNYFDVDDSGVAFRN